MESVVIGVVGHGYVQPRYVRDLLIKYGGLPMTKTAELVLDALKSTDRDTAKDLAEYTALDREEVEQALLDLESADLVTCDNEPDAVEGWVLTPNGQDY